MLRLVEKRVFSALKLGDAARVAPIDKLSVVLARVRVLQVRILL